MTAICAVFMAARANAQDTPTETPTITETPTSTPTDAETATPTRTPTMDTPTETPLPDRTPRLLPVPIAFQRGVGYRIVQDMTCAIPPCASASVPATSPGNKTLVVEILAHANVHVQCQVANGPDPNRGPVLTLANLGQTGFVEFTEWCDALWVEVESCAGNCMVSAWLRYGN